MIFSSLFNKETVIIEEAFKQRVVSFTDKKVHGYNYSIQVEIKGIVIIESIGLGSKCNIINNYDVYKLPEGNKLKQQSVLRKGIYYVNFFLYKNDELNLNSHKVCLSILGNEKAKKVVSKMLRKQDLIIKDDN